MITSAVALAATNEVEKHTENNVVQLKDYIHTSLDEHGETFNVGGARAAAGLLIFICCAGLVFHFAVISVRVYYIRTGTRDQMNLYIGLVS